MMIRGIGIDVVDLSRVEKFLKKGDQFPKKVLTPKEFEKYKTMPSEKRKAEYVAGRFSIKESFSKAWGTGLGSSVHLQDVETLADDLGHPITTSKIYDGNIFSSITHDAGIVVTQVVLEDK